MRQHTRRCFNIHMPGSVNTRAFDASIDQERGSTIHLQS
jgi:hypothetical protein